MNKAMMKKFGRNMAAIIKNKISFLIIFSFVIFANINAQEPVDMENEYLYKLKLIPKLLDENNWTEKENNIVGVHFKRLKEFTEKGVVILAGRTTNSDSAQFGIVIFKSTNYEEAEKFMNEDPAISEGIMTAELFPFRVALINNSK